MDTDTIVRDFCAAWGRADLEAIMSAFSEEAVYHNIPMDACEGKEAIRAFIEGFFAMSPGGIDFAIHHQVAAGNVVMNERTDTLVMDGNQIVIKVCGIFELNDDGLLTAWRDYFDMKAFEG